MYRIKSDSGESLVEVMVSAVIFLMMMAALQGSISFCTNAQHKSEQIRKTNAEICRNLQTSPYVPGAENKTYSFKAAAADGEAPGPEGAVLFNIGVELGLKEVIYQEADGTSKTAIFYMFGSAAEEGTGGETP